MSKISFQSFLYSPLFYDHYDHWPSCHNNKKHLPFKRKPTIIAKTLFTFEAKSIIRKYEWGSGGGSPAAVRLIESKQIADISRSQSIQCFKNKQGNLKNQFLNS